MINIIPMAGLGSRFANEGYTLPKPLIPVSGKPMIERVIERLPRADKWIFVVRPEHIERFSIDHILKEAVPGAIVVTDPDPKGQAATCMFALDQIADDEEIFIAPCDSSQLYDQGRFDTLRGREDVDSIVWSFTDDQLLVNKPTAWGWLKVEEDGETIADVSVKVPVSDDPRHDHAVTANFYFKRAKDFKDAYARMTEAEHKINGEYYVDAMPIFMRELGKKSVIFDVDLYVSWGKPEDLYLYQLREQQYLSGIPYVEGTSDHWSDFFDSLNKL